jgi:hypothetical protein
MVLFSNNLGIAMMEQFSGRDRHLQEKKLHRKLMAMEQCAREKKLTRIFRKSTFTGRYNHVSNSLVFHARRTPCDCFSGRLSITDILFSQE